MSRFVDCSLVVLWLWFCISPTFLLNKQPPVVDYLLYWIPFYYAFKMAFLLWAMLPQTRGAKFLYDNFLKDFLKTNESKIDAALKDAKTSAGKMAAEATAVTKEVVAAVSDNVKKSVGDKKDE